MLRTGRNNLCLRKYRLDDIIPYAEFASNPAIWQYMRDEFPHPCSLEQAEIYILGAMGQVVPTQFAIEWQGHFAGDIHLSLQTDILRHSAMLGYWMAEPFWGCGLMTEAVKTISRYAFNRLQLKRIVSRVFANNEGSVRVLEKAGFHREGTFRKAVLKNNQYIDQLQFALDVFQD